MASVSYVSAQKLIGLLQAGNKGGGMHVRVESKSRLALGKDPMQPTLAIDLARETIGPYAATNSKPAEITVVPLARKSRRGGACWLELQGKRYEYGSLRDLLSGGLRQLEAAHPGTLEKLSHIRPKSKRIVARDKSMLFQTEKLANEFGERLVDGWWYGTNNSAQETNAWLERACSCAGLRWGTDLRTSISHTAAQAQ